MVFVVGVAYLPGLKYVVLITRFSKADERDGERDRKREERRESKRLR